MIAPQHRTEERVTPRWTLKRLVSWMTQHHGVVCCRETLRKALYGLGFSWKKWRKLLNKANPVQREAFVGRLTERLTSATQGKEHIVYIDEAHIQLDTDEGYGWTVKGERAWISSNSPNFARVSCFGVYLYNLGKVQLHTFDKANSDHTETVLKHIRASLPKHENITIIWDNAPYHRSAKIKQVAQDLQITLEPLPPYSPDFMPVEHLWQWLREDVTYHTCYNSAEKLITHIKAFEGIINEKTSDIIDRLWTKTTLNPDEEKLRFSK